MLIERDRRTCTDGSVLTGVGIFCDGLSSGKMERAECNPILCKVCKTYCQYTLISILCSSIENPGNVYSRSLLDKIRPAVFRCHVERTRNATLELSH